MQFTKPMIELVYEIRRCTPSELKPAIKLANPDLFTELHNHYHHSASAVAKALIKELFYLAGDPWPARLEAQSGNVKQTVRMYRGQIQAKDRSDKTPPTTEKTPPKKKMMYRGQVVE